MASEYDSLLEEEPKVSEYDALLAPEPQAQPQQSGFKQAVEKGLGIAQHVAEFAIKPGAVIAHELAFPKEHEWQKTPLIPTATLTSIVHGLQAPGNAILENLGEGGKRAAEFYKGVGEIGAETIAGSTTPESLAYLAVGGALGKAAKPPPIPKNLAEVAGIAKPEPAIAPEPPLTAEAEVTPITPTVDPVLGKVEPVVQTEAAGTGEAGATGKIVAAAVRDAEGNVYTGTTHGTASDAALSAGARLPKVRRGELGLQIEDQGFVTDKGEYLTAEEAYQRALENKQIKPQDAPILEAYTFNRQQAQPVQEAVAPTTAEPLPKTTEEVIQNAQQIESPTRPDVNVLVPEGAAAREVYGGEVPAAVGGEGVPARGQGETLPAAQEQVAAPESKIVFDPYDPQKTSTERGKSWDKWWKDNIKGEQTVDNNGVGSLNLGESADLDSMGNYKGKSEKSQPVFKTEDGTLVKVSNKPNGDLFAERVDPNDTQLTLNEPPSVPAAEAATAAATLPQIPEGAKADVTITHNGEPRILKGVDAREYAGKFEQRRSAYENLIKCLGA